MNKTWEDRVQSYQNQDEEWYKHNIDYLSFLILEVMYKGITPSNYVRSITITVQSEYKLKVSFSLIREKMTFLRKIGLIRGITKNRFYKKINRSSPRPSNCRTSMNNHPNDNRFFILKDKGINIYHNLLEVFN